MPAIFLFPYIHFYGNNHYIGEVPEYWSLPSSHNHCTW